MKKGDITIKEISRPQSQAIVVETTNTTILLLLYVKNLTKYIVDLRIITLESIKSKIKFRMYLEL